MVHSANVVLPRSGHFTPLSREPWTIGRAKAMNVRWGRSPTAWHAACVLLGMATEVIREHVVEDRPQRRIVGVVARILDLAFGLLYTLLLVRFALVFFGARQGAGFYELIHDWSEPFYHPFEGLFATSVWSSFRIEWPLLVAVLAYGLLHGVIRGVMSLLDR